jgi:hypothetical protein
MNPPWIAGVQAHQSILSLELTGVHQDVKEYSGLFPSASVENQDETVMRTDFNETPRFVKL